jgi:hypothetical protein
MWKLPTSRRFWAFILVLSILVVIFWQHIFLLARILSVYPLWPIYSSSLSLSLDKDGLDTTFEKYPVEQWSVKWPPRSANGSWPAPDSSLLRLSDGSLARLPDETYGGGVSYSEPDESDLVPPILHHILLGMDRRRMPKTWTASRNSCLALVLYTCAFIQTLANNFNQKLTSLLHLIRVLFFMVCVCADFIPNQLITPTIFGTINQPRNSCGNTTHSSCATFLITGTTFNGRTR